MNQELPSENFPSRLAQQDVDALAEVYDRYAPSLFGLAAYILESREAAENILKGVFLRLWSEGPSLREAGTSLAAWLVIRTREAAVGELRTLRKNGQNSGSPARSASRPKPAGARIAPARAAAPMNASSKHSTVPEPPASHPPAALPGWMPRPEGIASIDERLVLLHKVLDQLPKPQRHALELAVFRGFSEAEIAAEMGEPLGRVRTSLRAALTFVKHRRRAVCGTWAADI